MLLLIPFILQGACIVLDEVYFHYKRGLPKWERIGHPLDTLSVMVCLSFPSFFSWHHWKIYVGLSILSCILVTKDEFVHKKYCPAMENWLHALLFLLHPLVLIAAGWMWFHPLSYTTTFLKGQWALLGIFCLYQTLYWNFIWKEKSITASTMNSKKDGTPNPIIPLDF